MPEFQLLRCEVALGGDVGNTVVRHRGNPILLPELILLQNLHGEEAITDVAVVGTAMMTMEEARTRLDVIYGPKVVTEAFPGARARLPNADQSIPICDRPIYVAKPTVPEGPEPRLRPLSALDPTLGQTLTQAPEQPREPEPTAEEIAAHTQDDDPGVDEDVLGFTRPRIEDQPQGRVSYNSQAREAQRTPDHLPDVMTGRTRQGAQGGGRAHGPAAARRAGG